MKILVTGGTVFVSKYVAEYFVKAGDDVYVLNRNTRAQPRGVKLIECDRRDIGGRLKNIGFDAVVDVTAYTAADVDTLLDGLGSFGDYVMISSSAVYRDTNVVPFKETAECGANKFWGDYGTNKLAAEHALTHRFPAAYILRPPYLYGEYNNVYREAFVFDCADRGLPFFLPNDGSMPLQFFYVGDICRFIEIILKEKPARRIFNVGDAPITIKEWVEKCYAAAGKKPRFVSVPKDVPQREYFPFHDYGYALDVSAQNSLIPESAHENFDAGLKCAYEWYIQNRGDVAIKTKYFEFIEKSLCK